MIVLAIRIIESLWVVEGIEEGDAGKGARPKHSCRLDEETTHETSNTVTNQLSRENPHERVEEVHRVVSEEELLTDNIVNTIRLRGLGTDNEAIPGHRQRKR